MDTDHLILLSVVSKSYILSRAFFVTVLESCTSLKPASSTSTSGGTNHAAATTGPANGPLPASSQPTTHFDPVEYSSSS